MSRSDGREPCARPSKAEHQLVIVGRKCYPIFAGTQSADRHALERLALERLERLVELAGRLRQLAADREAPVERQRRLLALGAVQAADAAGLQPEFEQLGERVGVVARDLALADGGDDVGEAAAPL